MGAQKPTQKTGLTEGRKVVLAAVVTAAATLGITEVGKSLLQDRRSASDRKAAELSDVRRAVIPKLLRVTELADTIAAVAQTWHAAKDPVSAAKPYMERYVAVMAAADSIGPYLQERVRTIGTDEMSTSYRAFRTHGQQFQSVLQKTVIVLVMRGQFGDKVPVPPAINTNLSLMVDSLQEYRDSLRTQSTAFINEVARVP